MENIINEKTKQVLVTGKASDKKQAFVNALNKIAKKVVSEEPNLVFKVEPDTFEIEELKEISKKEYFLFFFFPRIRKTYKVRLKVTVRIKMANIAKVECQKVNPDVQHQLLRI